MPMSVGEMTRRRRRSAGRRRTGISMAPVACPREGEASRSGLRYGNGDCRLRRLARGVAVGRIRASRAMSDWAQPTRAQTMRVYDSYDDCPLTARYTVPGPALSPGVEAFQV